MRIWQLFHGLAAITTALAINYPTTIEFDIVFPRNETYNSMMSMPLVFAIQNTEAAFKFGYHITWMVNTWEAGNTLQPSGAQVPPESRNNVWYEAGNFSHFDRAKPIQPGRHNLSVSFNMGTCTDTPHSVTIGGTVRKSEVQFTVVDDGSGKDVDLTSDCPVFKNTLTIERLTGINPSRPTCPVVAETEPVGVSNPCRAQMSEIAAECLMTNLTGVGDALACAELAQQVENDDDTGNEGNDKEDVGISDDGGEKSAGVRRYGSVVAGTALASILGLAWLVVETIV